ncbi:hypothetical protein DCO58_08265 [Helicobacter saguini]|uniref:Uncharacterized protein n=1 Tax=Helicobacter saguini TaxID=1548018 RepID=A0A347VNQ0_9HELI|nr:hypothetical protein [Helicobacter saguini]MWV61681.1 hypothetical protein [Helicobacter saguini]MWV67646.1 hypothetical protein [Helicobacter saguini]MWV69998.1 hypothetical protein [Helicobacter saguini]MWV72788.1 hypothetical protein [Helicobacter saguini]TLD92700.1 hypothetical protein LS64_009760 [Helicobacter saguini]
MKKIILYFIILNFINLWAERIESNILDSKKDSNNIESALDSKVDSKADSNLDSKIDFTQHITQDSNKQDSTKKQKTFPYTPTIHNNNQNSKLKFIYGFDFGFFADNLEDSFAYTPTRTLFAASIFPEIGASFYNQNIRVGTFIIYNMGEKLLNRGDLNIGLSLFYDIQHSGFHGFFGIFSRKFWLINYPRFFYRDDFLFFNPVINGILLQKSSKNNNFKSEFMLDWYGGNLAKRIDEFMVQIAMQHDFLQHKNKDSKQNQNILFYGAQAQLFHTKNSNILNPNSTNLDVFLLDRFYYNLYFGADFTSLIPNFNKFSMWINALGGVDRKRFESSGPEAFAHKIGGELNFELNFKGFGIANSAYFGQGQYKYFDEYGESIYWGLPFYQARFYDRLEAYYEYKNAYLRARFSLIGHFADNTFAHQQMLNIYIDTQRLIETFR